MERAAAHQVAIHHAGFVYEDPAANFQIELALRHRGHPTGTQSAYAGISTP
ncbi:MAG: hypothetical protein R3C12_22405 [Planctomycetaceae bacterium]